MIAAIASVLAIVLITVGAVTVYLYKRKKAREEKDKVKDFNDVSDDSETKSSKYISDQHGANNGGFVGDDFQPAGVFTMSGPTGKGMPDEDAVMYGDSTSKDGKSDTKEKNFLERWYEARMGHEPRATSSASNDVQLDEVEGIFLDFVKSFS